MIKKKADARLKNASVNLHMFATLHSIWLELERNRVEGHDQHMRGRREKWKLNIGPKKCHICTPQDMLANSRTLGGRYDVAFVVAVVSALFLCVIMRSMNNQHDT